MNQSAYYNPCSEGKLDVVKRLVSLNTPIDEEAIAYAALNGHLNVVKYLISVNAPIDEEAIAYAALNGHLDVVKYLTRLMLRLINGLLNIQLKMVIWKWLSI